MTRRGFLSRLAVATATVTVAEAGVRIDCREPGFDWRKHRATRVYLDGRDITDTGVHMVDTGRGECEVSVRNADGKRLFRSDAGKARVRTAILRGRVHLVLGDGTVVGR